MAQRELKLFVALTRAANRINRELDHVYRRYDLTRTQFAVLEVLLHKGDLSIGCVQDLVLTTGGNIPVVVNNLIKSGCITKYQDEEDRRKFMLSLTECGRALVERAYPEVEKRIGELFSSWNDEEQKTMLRYLLKQRERGDHGKKHSE